MRSHRHTDSSFPSGNAISSWGSGSSRAGKHGGLYAKIARRGLFIMLFTAAAATGLVGQDLGSSNKIFGNKKETTEPVKKPVTAAKARKPKPQPVRARSSATRSVRKAVSKPVAKTPVRIAPRPAVIAEKPLPLSDRVLIAEYADLVARGNAQLRNRNLPEAESFFQKAAAIAPGNPEAFASLGSLYSDSFRWEAAERSFRTAFALAPTDTTINIGLSRVLTQPVVSADVYTRYEEAERLARTAVRLSGTAGAYDQLGNTLERRGFIGVETESAYRQAIAADRQFAAAHAHLARLLRRKGRAVDAAAAYAAATANAVDAAQMTAVGGSFQSEQRYRESVPLLMTALHLDPRNYAAMVRLGRGLLATGDRRAAESHLIRATRLSPSSFAAYAELGRLYIREGKPEIALSTLDHGARLADRFERLELARDLDTLGDLFASQGHPSGAATAYSRSLTLDADRPQTAEKLAKLRR